MPRSHDDSLPLDTILAGDCLDRLADLPPASIDCAYLDPPFNTGRTQSSSGASYEDTWPDLERYLAYMTPRLKAIRRVLAPHGTLFLHCDWRTCHHFRFVLDELFGADRFINHLVWAYGLGGSSPRRFARKHDDILFYANGPDYYFQPPMVPATSNRMKGQLKKATDVIDIPAINNMADERVGYPTQKPLDLLVMLIGAGCPPGGLVLDPFCGSGTTLVAAALNDRHFIGIDASARAVELARQRLHDTAASRID